MLQKKEASYYSHLEGGSVLCELCPHRCHIQPEGKGICRTRVNHQGKLIAQTYGRIASYGKEPIEKKPLYHFYPGSKIFSVGSYGCNFTCDFCQNFGISQGLPQMIDTSPQNLVDIASNEKENLGIAYTYNEPTVWYEFMRDIASGIHKHGKKNVMVTNGYMNPEPLMELIPLIDAMNIDLKSMDPYFYSEHCGGKLEPVLEFIRLSAPVTHVEITTLLIGGLNTSDDEIHKIGEFIASINPEIPLHLSRYFPGYKMEMPPTEIALMEHLQTIAKQHLKYVYLGNVPEVDRNTYCSHCGSVLVDRSSLVKTSIKEDGSCTACGKQSTVIVSSKL